MPLDYSYTCPTIDSAIEDIKDVIRDVVTCTAEEFGGDYDEAHARNYANELIRHYEATLTNAIEEIRRTNEDMRSEADTQIDDIKDELSESDDKVRLLEEEIESLKQLLDELEYE